jgi:putative DNA primase/helicase
MLANPKEHKFFLLHGTGRNGKSTYLNLMSNLFGDYSVNIEPSSLVRRQHSGVNEDIARLRGARLAQTSEFEQGAVIDTPLIKGITGGDKRTACFKYQSFFEFTPCFVLFMGTNFIPTFDGGDYAMKERVVLIPFNKTIDEKDIKHDLPELLMTENSGILNLLLDNLKKYKADGLSVPQDLIELRDQAAKDRDLIGQFLEEHCNVGEKFTMANDLYKAYQGFCIVNGLKPMAQQNFTRSLELKGYKKKRISKGKAWLGITLREVRL